MSGFARDPADQDGVIEPIKRLEEAQTGLKHDEYKEGFGLRDIHYIYTGYNVIFDSGAEAFKDDVVGVLSDACRFLGGADRPRKFCTLVSGKFLAGVVVRTVADKVELLCRIHAYNGQKFCFKAPDGGAVEVGFCVSPVCAEHAACDALAQLFVGCRVGRLEGLNGVFKIGEFTDDVKDRLGDLFSRDSRHILDFQKQRNTPRDDFKTFGKEGNALLCSCKAQFAQSGKRERGDFARGVRHAIHGIVVKGDELPVSGEVDVRFYGVSVFYGCFKGGKTVFGNPVAVQTAVRDG